jgi:hypothetical protein
VPARCAGSRTNDGARETSRADHGAGGRRDTSAPRYIRAAGTGQTYRCPEAGGCPGGHDYASGTSRTTDQETGWQGDVGHHY